MNTAPLEPEPIVSPEPRFRLEPHPPLPIQQGWRIFLFFSCAVWPTVIGACLFADLLGRTGWTFSKGLLLFLFVPLFFLTAIGAVHAVFGFIVRKCRGEVRITSRAPRRDTASGDAVTAIVIPIYNEDARRVYEGLRVTCESLKATGRQDRFDFFILSDSTEVDKWAAEEELWYELVRELEALGSVFYRRRIDNEGKKSGNIRDFLNTWGRRYRYFIVFDADSVMSGTTILELVSLMEANPDVGLIQTVPALAGAESLFGRIQQFANRLYAPVFLSGLNFWARGQANYWGHNAIIRTEPFMRFCDLPKLPGRKPFGGHILSHDFVEAALLVRENWQVWLAYDLEGSYEEAPQGALENAERDRRWCQGNLQHCMVVLARGLRGPSRIHMLQGISSYLAAPFWLAFILVSCWEVARQKFTGLSVIAVRAATPHLRLTWPQHAFLVFGLGMGLMFLPKILALLDLAMDSGSRRAFGGWWRALAGVVGETIFSTLHAPLQMLWHTRFVISILMGGTVNWGTQDRGTDGVRWRVALRRMWAPSLAGIGVTVAAWRVDPHAAVWLTPILAAMVFSIPFCVWSSRASFGSRARELGMFLTPEETAPPTELATLRTRLALTENEKPQLNLDHAGMARIVLDPYVNAIHVSLLREQRLNPVYAAAMDQLGVGTPRTHALAEQMLASGAGVLQPEECALTLSDPDVVSWLHRQAWSRPAKALAPWWHAAFRQHDS